MCLQSLYNPSPEDGRRDQPQGFVVGRALFGTHGQSTEQLAAIDEALDPVVETVDGSIERPGTTFVPLARHGAPPPMLARIGPNLPAAVPLIAHDTRRSALGTVWPTPLDGTGLHEWCEDPRLVLLSRCEDEGHQLAFLFGPPVDFGTETAPATASGFGLWGPFLPPPHAGGLGS
jgi:hypothetical protein